MSGGDAGCGIRTSETTETNMAAARDMRERKTRRVPAAVKAGIALMLVATIGFVVASFEHSGTSTQSRSPPSMQVAPRASQGASDFDYFPDHYRNQPMEQAEPVATF
jgi:hypothetical protein